VTVGYWDSPWPGEDAGPSRRQSPHGVRGWGLAPGAELEVVARQDLVAATMPVVREPGELFLLRHTLGADTVSWVERIDPVTLATVGRSADLAAGPFWPGGMAAHGDGGLLVVYGRWAHRLDPDLTVVASRELPVDRPHNSFVVLADGTVVTKDLSRGPEPSTLSLLDPVTLEDRGAPVVMAEASVARLSADGLVVYAQGVDTALRFGWDPAAGVLSADDGWSSAYRTAPDQSFGWDAVVDGGQVMFMDNGDHTYEQAMALTGQGVAAGPVHLVRVPIDGGEPEQVEISGLPHGTQTNLPLFDPDRGIAVGYDSGNRVLAAFDLGPAGLSPRWRLELGASMHMVRFPDTGELIVNDHGPDGDDVVVVDLETGVEKARTATGSIPQSVVFPAVDHDGALFYCSFSTLARVTPA
jgi:hypothetical protein